MIIPPLTTSVVICTVQLEPIGCRKKCAQPLTEWTRISAPAWEPQRRHGAIGSCKRQQIYPWSPIDDQLALSLLIVLWGCGLGANNNSPCAINNVPLIFNSLHCGGNKKGFCSILEICMHSTLGWVFLGIPDRPFYHVVRRMGSSGNNKISIFALYNPPNDARRVALHSAAHCLGPLQPPS